MRDYKGRKGRDGREERGRGRGGRRGGKREREELRTMLVLPKMVALGSISTMMLDVRLNGAVR